MSMPFKLSISETGEATLTGIDYRKLRTILTAANVRARDKIAEALKEEDPEGELYWRDMLGETSAMLRSLEAIMISGQRC